MNAKGTTQSHNNMTGKYLRNCLLPIAVIETNELGKALTSALPNPGNQSTRNVRLAKKNTRFIDIWGISCLFWFWSSLSFLPTATRDWDFRLLSKAALQEWSQSSDHALPKLHGKVRASDPVFPKCIMCCNLPATQFWDSPFHDLHTARHSGRFQFTIRVRRAFLLAKRASHLY